VASRTVAKADAIIANHPKGTPMEFDIERHGDRLEAIVADHDLAVSLLPWTYHAQVARACIAQRKHMVTTSYVKDDMTALDGAAKEAGITLLNEIGVDPGIDHMTAMKVIHRVQAEGGEITAFTSFCGGLPAPEANDNPFGYKFSWSPRGVLLAGGNDARFKRDGRVVNVQGRDLFTHTWPVSVEVDGTVIECEGYPNRDSMPYQETYGIEPRDIMFRGTLRNKGWCETMLKVNQLGMIRTDEIPGLKGKTFAQLTALLIGKEDTSDLRRDLAASLDVAPDSAVISNMEWLGLLSDDLLPAESTPVDILTARMLEKMSYNPGERDLLVLQHQFVAEFADRTEHITSTMVDFGIPNGDSSMNRTVGLPAAVGARFILEGKFNQRGVVIPVMPELYEPALEELQRLGIQFSEKVETAG
jgi:saccharopine dehydrogenase-like NADP-dependent oxidoreductase